MMEINKAWQEVVDYIDSLENELDRELYLSGLTLEQRDYLNQIITKKLENNSQHEQNQIITGGSLHQLSQRTLVPIENEKKEIEAFDKLRNFVSKHAKKIGTIATVLIVSFGSWFLFGDFIKDKMEKTHLAYANTAFGNNYDEWVETLIGSGNVERGQDYDNDGLSNYEEFGLQIDPGSPDMNKNSLLDGVDILQGLNPLNNKNFNEKMNFSKEVIAYRLQQQALKAFLNAKDQFVSEDDNVFFNEIPTEKQPSYLTIEGLGLENVQIFWNQQKLQDQKLRTVLDQGVIHYSETKLPGEVGNTYIFGSSESEEDYFYRLSELTHKDSIYITALTNQDRVVQWKYVVVGNNFYLPNDFLQFEEGNVTELSLAALDQKGYINIMKCRLVSVIEIDKEEVEDLFVFEGEEEIVEEVEDKEVEAITEE